MYVMFAKKWTYAFTWTELTLHDRRPKLRLDLRVVIRLSYQIDGPKNKNLYYDDLLRAYTISCMLRKSICVDGKEPACNKSSDEIWFLYKRLCLQCGIWASRKSDIWDMEPKMEIENLITFNFSMPIEEISRVLFTGSMPLNAWIVVRK